MEFEVGVAWGSRCLNGATNDQRPGLPAALALGSWTTATFVMCGYYGLFLRLFLLLSAVSLSTRDLLPGEPIGNLLLGLALAAVLLLPVLPAQAQLTAGYTRA